MLLPRSRRCMRSQIKSRTALWALYYSTRSSVLSAVLQAIIQSAAALSKRPKPTSTSHESVGTEGTLQKRRNERDLLSNLVLKKYHLDQHVMTLEDLKKWGFMTEPPEGPGGTNPSDEGKIRKCERCGQQFMVKKKDEAEECIFHWGRCRTERSNG